MWNTVVVGNLTRDPELRFTASGMASATFSIAVNDTWTDKSGARQERTSFVDCIAWDSLAQNVAESLTKGARVIAYGRMEQRTWETDAGEKRSKVELQAHEVSPSLRWATVQVTKNPPQGGERPPVPNAPDAPAVATAEF